MGSIAVKRPGRKVSDYHGGRSLGGDEKINSLPFGMKDGNLEKFFLSLSGMRRRNGYFPKI
jgi:hypothetical protein